MEGSPNQYTEPMRHIVDNGYNVRKARRVQEVVRAIQEATYATANSLQNSVSPEEATSQANGSGMGFDSSVIPYPES